MEEHSPRPSSHDNPAVQHELSDANIRGILLFGLWLTLLGIVIYVAVWVLYQYLVRREPPSAPLTQQPIAAQPAPSKPQLQVGPESELSQLRSSEEETLRNYAWIDREKGVVRIPIERAMEIIAREGLPTRKEGRSGAETPLGKTKER
jgi:hypothetical protein